MVEEVRGFISFAYRRVEEIRYETIARIVKVVEDIVKKIHEHYGSKLDEVAREFGVVMVFGVRKNGSNLSSITPVIQIVAVELSPMDKRGIREKIRDVIKDVYSDARISIEFVKLPTVKVLFYYGEEAEKRIRKLERELKGW